MHKCSIQPWFVTGFTDAEGCFQVRVSKYAGHRLGWQVRAVFSIELNRNDDQLLNQIRTYFGNIGSISYNNRNIAVYFVSSLNDILTKIVPHFDEYTLITQKIGDYVLFKKVALIMDQKKLELQDIVNIKAAMNKGLSPALMKAFPIWKAVKRPVVINQKIPDPYWMAGFTSGDGGFLVHLNQNNVVQLRLKISQHSRDRLLLKSFISYFDCGIISKDTGYTDFLVGNFIDIYYKMIPFFTKYNIIGVKYENFIDWCKVAEIIKAKKHLTVSGFNQIIIIKQGMNKGRIKK